MINSVKQAKMKAPFLAVTDNQGRQSLLALESDTNLLIGSDSNCRLQLCGDHVEEKHCMVSRQGGQFSLRDWFTDGKTVLNGESITDEVCVECGDVLKVGDNTVQFVLTEPAALSFEFNAIDRSVTGPSNEPPSLVPSTTPIPIENPGTASIDQQRDVNALERELIESQLMIEKLQDALERQLELESDPGAEPEIQLNANAEAKQIQQLNQQVDQLQQQLAEQESLAFSADHLEANAQSAVEPEETHRLVERLEELLLELECADERVESLEELLRLSEENVEAEKDERSALESWVSQIEVAVNEKEQQHIVENERLKQQINQLDDTLKESERQLQQLLKARQVEVAGDAGEKFVEQLREQNDRLRGELNESRSRLSVQSELSQKLQNIIDERGLPPEVTKKMQETEVELVRLRAELARLRSESAEQRQLETRSTSASIQDADLRIQAMREHLKDVKAQEDQEKKDNQLGSRIARLWKRLGARE